MTATPAPLQELFAYCLEFAKTTLTDAGGFHPFGAKLSLEGKIIAVAGQNGKERRSPQAVKLLLMDAFASEAQNGNISGAALAANVNLPKRYVSRSSDAIRIRLEATGFARFIYVPYEIAKSGLFKKKVTVTLHEPFAMDVIPSLFQRRAREAFHVSRGH